MRAPRPFFACTIRVAFDQAPDEPVLFRVFTAAHKVLVGCLFADGSGEARWIDAPPPPAGCGFGPGQWAVISTLGVLWANGVEGTVTLVQPGAVDQGALDEALQFVIEQAPAWVEYSED